MHKMFTYSSMAAEKLYRPMLIKRIIYSIALIISIFVLGLILGPVMHVLGLQSKVVNSTLLLVTGIVQFGIIFFIYNFIWYSSKKNLCRNNYITVEDSGLEYYFEKGGGILAGGLSKYLCQLQNIISVDEDRENIIINGTIAQKSLSSQFDYCQIINSIKIPKVFNDMDSFVTLAKSRIDK